jgi:hypothetical protein
MKRGILAATLLCLLLHVGSALALGDRPPPEPRDNYQGLWVGTPLANEAGWAIGITHQGKTLYATWFTYDLDGSPMWLVMPQGTRRGYDWMYAYWSGALYRATGPATDSAQWIQVGMAEFEFLNADSASVAYSINGVIQSKSLAKQLFGTRVATCFLGDMGAANANYTSHWGSEQPGWGIDIAHQGDVIFAAWFTYRDGVGDWIVMPSGVRSGDGSYSGALYRTRGKPPHVVATAVGHAKLTFVDDFDEDDNYDYGFATFDFTLDGVSGSNTIMRRVFDWPVSVCH